MSSSEIDYPELVDDALRGVARRILEQVAENGLPGEHHFYISFATDHAAVGMSPTLRDLYPQEITIVLQNQFWDLTVDEEGFGVMLRFDGRPEHLRVPWQALKSFVDPAAEFGLRFDSHDQQPERESSAEPAEELSGTPGDVISLDEFRKRAD
jgi:hypothetical protein